MENPAQVFGGTPQAGGPIPPSSTLPDHWRMARAAHVDLLLMGMPRVNLLLIAPEGSCGSCSNRCCSICTNRSCAGAPANR